MLLLHALFALAQDPVRPAVERYAVDPAASEVGFDGSSTLHDFTGRTRSVSGELRIAPLDPRTCTAGSVRAVARTLDTDSKGRNSEMREKLQVEKHPELVFELGGAADGLPGARGAVLVRGKFVVRGAELARDVRVEVERLAGGALRVKGRAKLEMSDFGIEPPSLLFISTDDEIEAFWDLTLRPVDGGRDRLAARSHALAVTEEVRRPGEAPVRRERAERVFLAEVSGREACLWDRGAVWHVSGPAGSGPGGAHSIDLATATERDAAVPAETLFADLEGERASLAAQLEGARDSRRDALTSALARIDKALSLAPPAGEPERVEREGGFALLLAGEPWLEVSGARAEGDLAPALLRLEGLPAAVRDALADLRGVPERVLVRTTSLTEARTLELRAGPAEPAELPAWSLSPDAWVAARGAR